MQKDEESGTTNGHSNGATITPSSPSAKKLELHSAFYVSYMPHSVTKELTLVEYGYSLAVPSFYSINGYWTQLDSVISHITVSADLRIPNLLNDMAFSFRDYYDPDSRSNHESSRWFKNR